MIEVKEVPTPRQAVRENNSALSRWAGGIFPPIFAVDQRGMTPHDSRDFKRKCRVMSDGVSDPILDALLAANGCPYEGGTKDSVVWMLGYKAGVERATRIVAKAARDADPHKPTIPELADAPKSPDWRSPRPRRSAR